MDSAAAYAKSRGALVVAAAGNTGQDEAYGWWGFADIVVVGALNSSGTLASFSSRHSAVTLTAPGTSILSTCVGDSYCTMQGTSMSAPYVAGVAALVISAAPQLTVAETRAVLVGTARDLGEPGWDSSYGHGRVDVAAAVAAVVGVPSAPTLSASSADGGLLLQVRAASADAGMLDGFDVSFDGGAAWSAAGQGPLLTVGPAAPGFSYDVRVRARNVAGGSGPSAPVTVVGAGSGARGVQLRGGALPRLAAGATASGTSFAGVTATVSRPRGVARLDAGGARLSLPVPADGAVAYGADVSGQGSGLLPGSRVESWLMVAGAPVSLGSSTVAGDGTATLPVPLGRVLSGRPAPVGVHTVQVSAFDRSGRLLSFDVGVAVRQPARAPSLDAALTSVSTGAVAARLSGSAVSGFIARAGSGALVDVAGVRMELSGGGVSGFDLVPGRQVQVVLSGMAPSSRADLYLFSQPQLVVSAEVGSSGRVTTQFTVPATLPAGGHALQLHAVTGTGEVLVASAGVAVPAAVQPAPPAAPTAPALPPVTSSSASPAAPQAPTPVAAEEASSQLRRAGLGELAFEFPRAGSQVSGVVVVQAVEGVGASRMLLFADGDRVAELSPQPWGVSLDSTLLADGATVLTLVALAADGTQLRSDITVTVANGGLPAGDAPVGSRDPAASGPTSDGAGTGAALAAPGSGSDSGVGGTPWLLFFGLGLTFALGGVGLWWRRRAAAGGSQG
jgi:hypothetical protein